MCYFFVHKQPLFICRCLRVKCIYMYMWKKIITKYTNKQQQNNLYTQKKGKSHLASVRIVGGRAYNTRRATTQFDDDKVRNDVNLLSYYLKNRKAAAERKEAPVVLESGIDFLWCLIFFIIIIHVHPVNYLKSNHFVMHYT